MKYLIPFLWLFLGAIGYAQEESLEDLLNKGFQSKDSSYHYFAQSKRLLQSKADTASYLYFQFYRKNRDKEIDSANYYAERLIPLFKALDTTERLRKVYERLHFQELASGNYEGALKFCQNAYDLAERRRDTAMMSLHLSDMSIIYHDFEDYERGVEYGKMAYKTMDRAVQKSYKYLIYANNAVGINFDDWGKADSALYYHFQNMKLLEKVDDTLPFTFIFNNIGNTYLKQEKYVDAKEFLEEALRLNKIRKRDYNLASNYTNLATIAYRQRQYELAKIHFKDAYFHAENSTSIEKIRDVVQQEAWFYKELGDFEKALERQEEFYKLRDSVFNEDRAKKMAELETKYQTEKKEREILSQRAELAEKDLQVRRKNTWIFGGFGLALILGLLGYLLFNQQKLKNNQLKKEGELKSALARIETQNKLQEQRLRISRDLHDNIGSQLTFVTSSVDNLKYKMKGEDGKVTQKLGEISDFTTQTIYELRDTIWAMNKTEITFEDLQGRIANFMDKAGGVSDKVSFKFKVKDGIGKDAELTSIQGMNVYRIIQEAVNNALKYADASTIHVAISTLEDANMMIAISDDGKGFNLDTVEKGNGLNNMKKRARDLKGNLQVSSEENEGTEVQLTFKYGK
ncbi:MAG: sensor histidine kinase [Flavobacteriaceae bacterium]|nr:sensor histidine kinase [Flavobacteriaceae bacterium]